MGVIEPQMNGQCKRNSRKRRENPRKASPKAVGGTNWVVPVLRVRLLLNYTLAPSGGRVTAVLIRRRAL